MKPDVYTDRQTDGCLGMQTDKQMENYTDRDTDRQIYEQTLLILVD